MKILTAAAAFVTLMNISVATVQAQQAVTILEMEGLVMEVPASMQAAGRNSGEDFAVAVYARPSNPDRGWDEYLTVLVRATPQLASSGAVLSEYLYGYNGRCGRFAAQEEARLGVFGYGERDSAVVTSCIDVRLSGAEFVTHDYANEFSAIRVVAAPGRLFFIQYLRVGNGMLGENVLQDPTFVDEILSAFSGIAVAQ